jgi:hypothetical protein
MPKATIVASIAILILAGSYWKAGWISSSVLVPALFTTWRRYLEPLCLFSFVAVFATFREPSFLLRMLGLR